MASTPHINSRIMQAGSTFELIRLGRSCVRGRHVARVGQRGEAGLSKTLQSSESPAPLSVETWFDTVPDGLRSLMLRRSFQRRARAGQLIFAGGDPASGLYWVVHGRVELSTTTADGRVAILTMLSAGGWFGLASLIDGLPKTHDAYAHTQVDYRFLTKRDFEAILDAEPRYAVHFARLLALQVRQSTEAVRDHTLLSLHARLAKRLMNFADVFGVGGKSGAEIDLDLSQEKLGEMMGATRQTVSAALKAWEARGWIVIGYRRISLLDARALQAVAAGAAT